jgi:hypothetical protein
MSALHPKADITERRRHVRLVPITDIAARYSITSSAVESSAAPPLPVMPSIF